MDKKMRNPEVWRTLFWVCLIGVIIGLGANFLPSNVPAVSQSLYWGSTGQQVKDLQWKLSQWGYYHGSIDGDFGQATWDAVRRFQQKNGLSGDGVAGKDTLTKLGLWTGVTGGSRAVQSVATTRGLDRRGDVTLLARIIHSEAGGEPYVGQVAVGAVILNRVASPLFPDSLSGVIYQPTAFESVSNGYINTPPAPDNLRAAQDALNGFDPTYGCLFFWNPAKPVSSWIWSRAIVTQIGDHVFAK